MQNQLSATRKIQKKAKPRHIHRLFKILPIICLIWFLLNHTGAFRNPYNQKDWQLILINNSHPIKAGYDVNLVPLKTGHLVDARILPELQKMFNDARTNGLKPVVVSGYRTREKQEVLFDNKVNEYLAQGYSSSKAHRLAKGWVAEPGTSEHQTGLALDIISEGSSGLTQKWSNSAVYRWLEENGYHYGFVLRYSGNKTAITGVNHEPWHFRYVGVTVATTMHQTNECLEEYLNQH